MEFLYFEIKQTLIYEIGINFKMILKLKIKSKHNKNAKNMLITWIQRRKLIESDLLQVLEFFKDQIYVSKIRRLLPFFKITSENPAIIISLFSTLLELIPELYFNDENCMELERVLNSK